MTERHVAAFGEIGLPHRPLEFARRLGHLGHLEVLGRQGQARAAITEVAGCDEETTWVEAYRKDGSVNDLPSMLPYRGPGWLSEASVRFLLSRAWSSAEPLPDQPPVASIRPSLSVAGRLRARVTLS